MAITERKMPLNWWSFFFGLSTDAKPTGIAIGSVFIETNTGKIFMTADGTNWFQIVA